MSINSEIINLESLIELSGVYNEIENEEFLLKSILYTFMGKLKFTRSAAVYANSDGSYETVINLRINNLDELLQKVSSFFFVDSDPIVFKIETNSSKDVLIFLSGRFTDKSLSAEELYYSKLVVSIAANSLQNLRQIESIKNRNKEITEKNQLLRTLFEINKDFSKLLKRDEIIRTMNLHLMGQLMINRFAVALKIKGQAQIIVNRLNLSDETVITKALENCNLEITEFDVNNSDDIRLICPMALQDEVKGCLILGNKMNNTEYTEQDFNFLTSLTNICITALENERLLGEEIEKKKLETEINYALEIQKRLLPKENPKLKNFDVAGKSIPSYLVGGDYYDFIELSDNLILFTIMDVSGKGLPASLIMSNVQATLRVVSSLNNSLEEISEIINKQLFESTSPDKFVTGTIALLDTVSGEMAMVNCGHTPSIFISNGNVEHINSNAMLLGFSTEFFEPQVSKINLERADDIFVMYTDGYTEAFNTKLGEFGCQNLIDEILKNKNESADKIIENIDSVIRDYADDISLLDDLTMIVIKRTT